MKNDCLNVWKGIAAFFIVWIHCRFPGKAGELVEGLARFAVPLFFMISGHFSRGKEPAVLWRRFRSTLRMYLWASAVYFLWRLVMLYREGSLSLEAAGNMFSLKALGELFLWNRSPFAYHLWFLGALLYCYLFYGLLVRLRKEESVYLLIPLCLGANLLLGEGLNVLGRHIPTAFVRNFWLTGLPFFLLGHWLAGRKAGIEASGRTGLYLAAGGICLTVAETLFFGKAELYLGSVLLGTGLFVTAVRNPGFGRGSLPAHIGEKDSRHIYLWHVILYQFTSSLAACLGIRGYKVYQWLVPLWVCLASWMLAEILERRKRYEQRHMG